MEIGKSWKGGVKELINVKEAGRGWPFFLGKLMAFWDWLELDLDLNWLYSSFSISFTDTAHVERKMADIIGMSTQSHAL